MILCLFLAVAQGVAHPRFASITNFGAGVLVICAIMLPLVDIIRDFDANDFYDKILDDVEFTGATDSSIELAFEEGIADYVSGRWGIDRDYVRVSVDGFDMESLTAERIYVTLSGKGLLVDYKRIEEALVPEFTRDGECEVSLDLG
jgi:hypothetical protein